MIPYKEFAPSPFDPKGLALDDQQDWLVAPVSQNRDSEALEKSNFRVTLRDLEKVDKEGNDHEIHSFGHWACGWFEIILIRPGSECEKVAKEIENCLSDYPCLDEMDYSELELEEENE